MHSTLDFFFLLEHEWDLFKLYSFVGSWGCLAWQILPFSVFLFLLSLLFLQESDGTAVARGFRFHRSTLLVSVFSMCICKSCACLCVQGHVSAWPLYLVLCLWHSIPFFIFNQLVSILTENELTPQIKKV